MPRKIDRSRIIDDLQARIAALQARLKEETSGGHKRRALLAYCQKHDIDRKDLSWVKEQLPTLYVTPKQRKLAAAAKRKNAHASKGGLHASQLE